MISISRGARFFSSFFFVTTTLSTTPPCRLPESGILVEYSYPRDSSTFSISKVQVVPISAMKVITANFVTCAVKECKTSPASFPLHFHDAELEQQELEFQPEFIRNVIPRIDWEALRATANELGFPSLPDAKPEGEALENEQTMRDLHRMLLETHVSEGKLVCGNCNHAYMIKEGIANFLLPSHLGESYSLGSREKGDR
ncbi:unnamed protein product [Penicillium salamii]|nr:unnamed protein product [Penicillium salamii]